MSKDKIFFFFPIEGPQSFVISYKFYQAPPKARHIQEEPDAAGFDLSKLPLEKSQGELCDTTFAQPVIIPGNCFRLAPSETST